MKVVSKSKVIKILMSTMVLMMVLTSSMVVFANGFSMSTQYPGTTAKAGDTVSFNLDFYTNVESGENVALSIANMPEAFEGNFLGGGNKISDVYIKQGDNAGLVSFLVKIPEELEQGSYQIQLNATGESASSVLTLNLDISEEVVGNSTLVTEYAQQEGSADTSFTFTSTIQNNTPAEQSYSLSAEAPAGWLVSFMPAADITQVAAINVDKNASQGLSIMVTPPVGIEAGEYKIPISAISSNETLSGELIVNITGLHEISLSTPSGRLSLDANANKASEVVLSITNQGNVDLQNINLTTEAPANWNITFSESTIELLEAGTTKEVTATITPSEDALSGDYVAVINAGTVETSDNTEFRVSVKTETIWGIVGIFIIIATCGGLYLVFQKYGRR